MDEAHSRECSLRMLEKARMPSDDNLSFRWSFIFYDISCQQEPFDATLQYSDIDFQWKRYSSSDTLLVHFVKLEANKSGAGHKGLASGNKFYSGWQVLIDAGLEYITQSPSPLRGFNQLRVFRHRTNDDSRRETLPNYLFRYLNSIQFRHVKIQDCHRGLAPADLIQSR
ncbi:MAG TPA: hypothetical protein VGK22_00105 [Candidatus Angelobacter sp.]|jgi:hypothetical protein